MNSKITQEIMERIRKRRLFLGLSLQALSDKTGINKSTLQRYKTGFINNLPVDKLEMLASALEITPANLMGWEKSNHYLPYEEIELNNIEDAMQSILKKPLFTSYYGYNTNKMSEDDLTSFTKEILRYIHLLSYEYK
ncbi:helix-turn-helix domain-containing protein [Clostridium sp. DL1XJH146]